MCSFVRRNVEVSGRAVRWCPKSVGGRTVGKRYLFVFAEQVRGLLWLSAPGPDLMVAILSQNGKLELKCG